METGHDQPAHTFEDMPGAEEMMGRMPYANPEEDPDAAGSAAPPPPHEAYGRQFADPDNENAEAFFFN
jgi:hypothetical protein